MQNQPNKKPQKLTTLAVLKFAICYLIFAICYLKFAILLKPSASLA
jgi:hypothetical protein